MGMAHVDWEMGNWQDIETAPKDGRPVLVCCSWAHEPSIARWLTHKGKSKWCALEPHDFDEPSHWNSYWANTEFDPDCWQALPAMPRAKAVASTA